MSRRIAYAGVFTGISVVLLYLCTVMPTGKLTLYFLASLPVAFTIMQSGAGAGITLYFAVCILTALVSGNIYGVIPFVLFFGHYPVFKYLIEKKSKAMVGLLLKFAVFNLSMFIWYLLFRAIFLEVLPSQLSGSGMLAAVFIAALQAAFFVYDCIFSRFIYYCESRFNMLRRQ